MLLNLCLLWGCRWLWGINAVRGDWIGSLLSCLPLSLLVRAEELVPARADQVMCTCSDAAPGSSSVGGWAFLNQPECIYDVI